MHGFESVVGPVKGVFDKEMSLNKAREHTLLRSDRPPYVTILSLGQILSFFLQFIIWCNQQQFYNFDCILTFVFIFIIIFIIKYVMQQQGCLMEKEQGQRSVNC